MIQVGLECSSSLTAYPTGVQRYIDGVILGLGGRPDIQVTRLLKISRWRKRNLVPALPVPHRWYGPLVARPDESLDLVHCMDPTLPWPSARRPLVVTIHDLYLALHAEVLTEKERDKKLSRIKDCCAQAAHLIVPTDAVAKELRTAISNHPDISVVPHGISPIFSRKETEFGAGSRSGAPYVLCFCGGRRKNLENVIKAFHLSKADAYNWRLLVVGKPSEEERRFISGARSSSNISVLSQVPDKQLISLYRQAKVVCYPSLYEGFGFPVLESMAAGAPVVTTEYGATAEVADGHAVLVDPNSAGDIAEGLDRAVEVDKVTLHEAMCYSKGFSWQNAANSLSAIYRSMI